MPHYDACYMIYTVHSLEKGKFQAIDYQPDFKEKHLLDHSIYMKKGEIIDSFTGANKAIGDVLLKFEDREDCNAHLQQLTDYIKVNIN